MFGLRRIIDSISNRGNGMLVDFSKDLDMNANSNPSKSIGGKFGFMEILQSKKRFANSIRKSNPIAPGLADIVNWVLYDRTTFAAGTTTSASFKFFNTPQGATKTKADTNMEQVSRLPDPQWFNAMGLGFFWNPNIFSTDLIAFLQASYFEFWVGQKSYIEGPLQCFPGAAGIAGFNVAATATITASSNGIPRTDNMFDLRLPAGMNLGTDATGVVASDGLTGITILQGQQFYVNTITPSGGVALTAGGGAGGTGLNLMCFLYGILSRGVQ